MFPLANEPGFFDNLMPKVSSLCRSSTLRVYLQYARSTVSWYIKELSLLQFYRSLWFLPEFCMAICYVFYMTIHCGFCTIVCYEFYITIRMWVLPKFCLLSNRAKGTLESERWNFLNNLFYRVLVEILFADWLKYNYPTVLEISETD